jgi:hypothetical protein
MSAACQGFQNKFRRHARKKLVTCSPLSLARLIKCSHSAGDTRLWIMKILGSLLIVSIQSSFFAARIAGREGILLNCCSSSWRSRFFISKTKVESAVQICNDTSIIAAFCVKIKSPTSMKPRAYEANLNFEGFDTWECRLIADSRMLLDFMGKDHLSLCTIMFSNVRDVHLFGFKA